MMRKIICLWLFLCLFCLTLPLRASQAIDDARLQSLPIELGQTLQRLRQGATMPYPRDGVVFGNYERILPVQKRGFYREYTVPTPGLKHRGARRLVIGGEPRSSRLIYYSEDHYRSFKRVIE